MKARFIAHRRAKDGEPQSLCTHLTRVSVLAGQFAENIGLREAGRIVGLLHDLGKATDQFQRYIQSATGQIDPDSDGYVDPIGQRGKIDHSSAGAQIVFRELSDKGAAGRLVAQFLSLCIASHHSGLIDCLLPSGEDNYTRRMQKADERTRVSEALSSLTDDEKRKLENRIADPKVIDQVLQKMKSLREDTDDRGTLEFKIGLLIRFLFSCLIDADRLDTADFEFPRNISLRNHGNYEGWPILIDRLNVRLKSFKRRNKVDDVRNEVSRQCFECSSRPKGLYQLTVPTGGGKTLASLRFALHHAECYRMQRVFYIIPYTSIIDQNADEVRKILEDKDGAGRYLDQVVLEHHSNLTPEEETKRQGVLSENWDSPIVFTTQVQFLEALFGSGTRGARRMHQLANSVIIFDEVQAIPVRCVHLFNLAIRFLVHSCGSTVVLCTATQPLLDRLEPRQRSLTIPPDRQMIGDVTGLFQQLSRVTIHDKRKPGGWSEEDLVDLIYQEVGPSGSILVVVNTKAAAQRLYQALRGNGVQKTYHLSTNMCPAHRMVVLKAIRDRLDKKQPTVCVSTQLIEAGVDVDFGTVIRYLAGLDSIAQAAGRCNRHGLRPSGDVFVVNAANENLSRLEDIRIGKENAERVLDEYLNDPKQFAGDILGPAAMNRYYFYYFHQRSEKMNYPLSSNSVVGREDNLFDLLSTNPKSLQEYHRVNRDSPLPPLRQSFQTASKTFRAIDSPTQGIVVPYGSKGKDIINELCSAFALEKQHRLLRKAQKYSVNVFPHTMNVLARQRAIHEVQEGSGVFYLESGYYSDEVGLSIEIVNEPLPQTFQGGVYG